MDELEKKGDFGVDLPGYPGAFVTSDPSLADSPQLGLSVSLLHWFFLELQAFRRLVSSQSDNQPKQGFVNPSAFLITGPSAYQLCKGLADVWELKEHKEKVQIKINKCLIKDLQSVTLCQLH